EEVFQVADRVTVLRDGQTVGTRNLRQTPIQRSNNSTIQPSPDSTFQRSTDSTALTQSDLIHLMVGREVSTIFPPPENVPGAPVLSVRNLGCRSSGIHQVD